jgi:hypothetical protein
MIDKFSHFLSNNALRVKKDYADNKGGELEEHHRACGRGLCDTLYQYLPCDLHGRSNGLYLTASM